MGDAERKAIICRHQDAMTAFDRQGELQLAAELSSLPCTTLPYRCPPPPTVISLSAQTAAAACAGMHILFLAL